MKDKRICVTGGRGFIGSHLVNLLLNEGFSVIDIDIMGYPASKKLPWDSNPNYELIQEDISKLTYLPLCDILINCASQTHVDNSISSPDIFEKNNVRGTVNLLNLVRSKAHERPLFLQISTDEVYGSSDNGEKFTEEDKLNPSSPYSSSKAAAEMFVIAYGKTYGIEYQITRSSNNYGPRQFPEKLIPKIIESLNRGNKIPLHGDGSYKREWIYVGDNVEAIYKLCFSDVDKNQIWNISSNNSLTNNGVAKKVCGWLDKDFEKSYEYIKNRYGQDNEYSIDSSKIRERLGWTPKHDTKLFNFLSD